VRLAPTQEGRNRRNVREKCFFAKRTQPRRGQGPRREKNAYLQNEPNPENGQRPLAATTTSNLPYEPSPKNGNSPAKHCDSRPKSTGRYERLIGASPILRPGQPSQTRVATTGKAVSFCPSVIPSFCHSFIPSFCPSALPPPTSVAAQSSGKASAPSTHPDISASPLPPSQTAG
jgi:hypothetical protein